MDASTSALIEMGADVGGKEIHQSYCSIAINIINAREALKLCMPFF